MVDSRIARAADGLGSTSPAPAVTRAAAVLEALAEAPSGRLTLSDLARELGIPKSSTSN
ncbi:MAG: helix-turn-helix domain-containing protein, partial [Actinomycetota bacterium]|nr:helix-turn-helix domain-containing protein [Actinomycetota bacterium]